MRFQLQLFLAGPQVLIDLSPFHRQGKQSPRVQQILKFYRYLFFAALSPRPLSPQILLLQFQGIGWYYQDEVLKFSTKM